MVAMPTAVPEKLPEALPEGWRQDPARRHVRENGNVITLLAKGSHVLPEFVDFDDSSEAGQKALEDVRMDVEREAVIGLSYAVQLVETPKGRRALIMSLRQKRICMRASRRTYTKWRQMLKAGVSTTSDGLLVSVRSGADATPYGQESRTHATQHVWLHEDGSSQHSPKNMAEYFQQTMTAFFRKVVTQGRDLSYDRLFPARHTDMDREAIDRIVQEVVSAFAQEIEELPKATDRLALYPGGRIDREPASAWRPYLDARDMRQVAENSFGKRATTRPLVRAVSAATPSSIRWMSLYRGLVPTEHIVAALERGRAEGTSAGGRGSSKDLLTIRKILVRTPKEALVRILKEPQSGVQRALIDAARSVATIKAGDLRDVDALPRMIQEAGGQRRIRGAADLEEVVGSLPEKPDPLQARRMASAEAMHAERQLHVALVDWNRESGEEPVAWDRWKSDEALRQRAAGLIEERRRARMTRLEIRRAEEAAERLAQRKVREAARVAFAEAITERIDGVEALPGLRIRVAREPRELAEWSNIMQNCIEGYASSLGFDVFAALVDQDGKMAFNIQVDTSSGPEVHGYVAQLLGKHNRAVARVLGPEEGLELVESLRRLDLDVDATTWGVQGLDV